MIHVDWFQTLRWFTGQLYVNETKATVPGYNVNASKGGTTVSTKKRGGWANAWLDAQRLGGWVESSESK